MSTAPTIREEWDRLMSTYTAANAADDDVNARYDAASAEHKADSPEEPEIDLALLGLDLVGSNEIILRRLLYADDLDKVQAKVIGATGITRFERVNRDPERVAEIEKVREFRRLYNASEERNGILLLDEEWEKAGKQVCDARDALLHAPAPDLAAVRWKMDQLFGREATGPVADEGRSIPAWNCGLTDAVIADLDRLQTDFAESWLSRWMDGGGSVCLDHEDRTKAHFGFPTYDGSPEYEALSDAQRDNRGITSTLEYRYYARMTEMVDGLNVFPGGADMIKAHMRDTGRNAIYRKRAEGAEA